MEKLLQVGNKGLGGLGHLWLHNHVAVTLTRVFSKEILMVGFAHPESFEGQKLSNYCLYPDLLSSLKRLLEKIFLVSTVVKHTASVAGSDVVTLAVELSWVVKGKENIENDFGRDYGFIKYHSGDFGMPSSFSAHGFIAGIIKVPAAVADLNIADTTKLHKG